MMDGNYCPACGTDRCLVLPAADAHTLAAELERLHTWAGLMSLLDEHYPSDVVTGESGDPGPRIVALTRDLDQLREQLDLARRSRDGWQQTAAQDADELSKWRRACHDLDDLLATVTAERDTAQAAIQRVRGLLHERRKYSPTVQIHDVLRTLDGDTTEEAS